MAGLNELLGGFGGAPGAIPTTTIPGKPPVTPAAWDFWTSIQNLMDDPETFAKLKAYYTAPSRKWRMPKQAEDMLGFAELANSMDDPEMATQMMWNVLNRGFSTPEW